MKLRDKLLIPIGMALLAVLAIHLGALYAASQAWNVVDHEVRSGHAQVVRVQTADAALQKQVHAWKNVLLRGQDEADRLRYFREFRAHEDAFREPISRISTDGTSPRWARDEAVGLLAEHREIARVYREALDIFQTSKEGGAELADAHARGVDRDLSAALGRYRDRIEIASDQRVSAARRHGQRTVLGLVIGGAGLSLLVIGLMLAIVHKLVVRPAQLASALSRSLLDPDAPRPPEVEDRLQDLADDELGQLLDALQTLHDDLREERSHLSTARKELASAQSAAEAAATAKRAFIARITHELRTPVHGLVGCLSLLDDEVRTEDGTTLLQAAEDSVQRLAALVEDILEFTQVSGGDLDLESQAFNVEGMLDGLIQRQRPLAEATGCRLTLAVAPGGPREVKTDRQRLHGVVEELVRNAISAAPTGHVELILTTANEGSRARVRIDVLDDGPGIPPELLETIFQPFTQVEEGYDRSKQGAGLGLSRCRRTVEHLGGLLHVSSTGTGTRFWLELTLERGRISHVDGTSAQTWASGRTPLPGHADGQRLMVVGKGPIAHLQRLGIDVHQVHTLDAALSAIASDAFPMVLVDITRFGIGSLDDLRALIDSAGGLTALVASARPDQRDACLSDGWDDVLLEGADTEDVEDLLMRWLDHEPTSMAV